MRGFAKAHGLAVVQEEAARRTMVLSGTVAQFNQAFGVDLQRFEHAGGSYRGRTGPVHLPPELSGLVKAVPGRAFQDAAALGITLCAASGDSGAFAASAGWDACTGLGSPNGARIAKII